MLASICQALLAGSTFTIYTPTELVLVVRFTDTNLKLDNFIICTTFLSSFNLALAAFNNDDYSIWAGINNFGWYLLQHQFHSLTQWSNSVRGLKAYGMFDLA